MRRLIVALLLASSVPAFADGPVGQPDLGGSALTASIALRVDDREQALDRAVALARERGGWFASLTQDRVSLRVPAERARDLVDALRAEGEPFERTFDSTDLRAQLVDLEARLSSRRGILDKYMEVLGKASPKSIVSVEREITRLVAEIENLEGQLRVLRDRAAFARVDVSFRYRERRAPARAGTSSFEWINTVNVADLIADLQADRRATRSGVSATAPEGFSAFRRRARFQALSPDDVIYRVRTAKNKPRADLDFWKEALLVRMKEAGYRVVTEQPLPGTTPGHLLELAGADGEKDRAYLVGLFVRGRRLVLAECTGEADRLAKRREAVVAAMQDLGR
jgi:hypothetical protein